MDHWVVVSDIGCDGTIKLYDSIYASADNKTKKVIENLFGSSRSVEMVWVQKHDGRQDCELFAIAIATDIAFGEDP